MTKESATLSVTVQLNDLKLGAHAEGRSLTLDSDESETAGNWIHFTTTAGDLPKGVSVAFFATDANGNPLGVDGQPVASIGQAILGWVGAVGSDSGATLLEGAQSIFLHTDRQLHFARIDGDGRVTDEGPVAIQDNGNGTLTIDLDGITLSAEIENTLTAEMQTAAVQRIHGLPLIHLSQGGEVEVALAGSTYNSNTLGFVRFDLDHATGALSLEGVAYGDSNAFRDAVLDSLDAGFGATVGGNFSQTASWTVAGDTGYYAPVLITQSGEVFVPGNANRDGYEYIRSYGANSFGFEDLTYEQGSDFDYNDMLMTLRLVPDAALL